MAANSPLESIDKILEKLSVEDQEHVKNIHYGADVQTLEFPENVKKDAALKNLEIGGYKIPCNAEQLRAARVVRIGAFQHQLPLPTVTPITQQQNALFKMAKEAIALASVAKVNVFCFQEAWNMPFAFCTRVKQPWAEYAESAEHGPTTKFLQELAKQYNMVIISPILERDQVMGDKLWNTAVVIDNHGYVLGKHRKNHIPRVSDFNESMYYMEGNTGHPVFETEFGKIAINICYGRHHPLNWLAFGINGAEIVFNPSATTEGLSERVWGVEARNAAFANGYYTVAINRVGTEVYPNELTSDRTKPGEKRLGHFYGSSFVTAPSGSRTPGLSRTRNGLLVTEVDLNLCRQSRDYWTFQMTQRLEMYADLLVKAIKPDFVPQTIRRQ